MRSYFIRCSLKTSYSVSQVILRFNWYAPFANVLPNQVTTYHKQRSENQNTVEPSDPVVRICWLYALLFAQMPLPTGQPGRARSIRTRQRPRGPELPCQHLYGKPPWIAPTRLVVYIVFKDNIQGNSVPSQPLYASVSFIGAIPVMKNVSLNFFRS